MCRFTLHKLVGVCSAKYLIININPMVLLYIYILRGSRPRDVIDVTSQIDAQ